MKATDLIKPIICKVKLNKMYVFPIVLHFKNINKNRLSS